MSLSVPAAVSGQAMVGDRQAMSNRYATLDSAVLLVTAGDVLRLNQRELGEAIGVSRRTIVRWTACVTSMGPIEMTKLARLVFPHDVQLAEGFALHAGSSLEALGLVRPAPPPAPPPPLPPPGPPPPPPARLVDIVVCAAADALDLPPRATRPGVLAALRCVRELGMKLEDVEQSLAEREKALKPRVRGPVDKPRARRA
jgi:hypothetical protein